MKLTRRDFLKSASAMALAASALGLGTLAFAEDSVEVKQVVTNDELAAKFVAGKSGALEYCCYDPKQDVANLPAKLPLVVFLHGEDGKGENGTQLLANRGATFFMEPNQLAKNPCFVLAPQCPGDNWVDGDVPAAVKALIDEFCAANPVDVDRIYIQGMSMGGTGTWNMLLTYPTLFAGAIPMCGGVPAAWYENKEAFAALKNVPIWAFHSADDDVVPESETANAVAAVKEGGSGCMKYETYSAGSIIPPHNIWERVYSIGTPYNWLFIQSLTRTNHGELAPNMLFSHKKLNGRVTEVHDYEVGKLYVVDYGTEAMIIDSAMGGYGAADLYAYIRDNILTNKDAELELIITHAHGDHIMGIPTLAASGKLRKTYIHAAEEAGTLRSMERFGLTKESLNMVNVADGDVITMGGENYEILVVSGHTNGSICIYYNDYIFTGDAVGSGDLWLNTTYENYQPSIDRLMADVAVRGKEYELLTGHFENLNKFTNQYLKDMTMLVKLMLLGKIEPGFYTRRVGKYATYGEANIYYNSTVFNEEAPAEA